MEYLIHLAVMSAIYAILAIGLNLVVGYTGLLSVAHAAFYGIGAYAVAILTTALGWNFFPAAAAGVALSTLAALLIGLVLSRFRDDYYALASIGFNSIVFSILLNWHGLTRGPLGISGIPRPSLGGFVFTGAAFAVFSIALAALAYAAARWIERSSFGRALRAIREDEEALQVFGYRTTGYKLAVFVMGAALAAGAGAVFAAYITFVDPAAFALNESVFILVIIILGGLADLRGSVIGAVVLILLPEALRFVGFPNEVAAHLRQVVYGLIIVLLMMYRPQGLLGKFRF